LRRHVVQDFYGRRPLAVEPCLVIGRYKDSGIGYRVVNRARKARHWSFMLREVWPCSIIENVCSAGRSSPSSGSAPPSCFASPPKKCGPSFGRRASPKSSPRRRSSIRSPPSPCSRVSRVGSKRWPTAHQVHRQALVLRQALARCINCRAATRTPQAKLQVQRRQIHFCAAVVRFHCRRQRLRPRRINQATISEATLKPRQLRDKIPRAHRSPCTSSKS
jgi:hypothetical protein